MTLHWALALLIIAALTLGFFGLAATPNADPRKITVLRWHMTSGMLIFALMAVRYIIRMRTSRAAGGATGYPLLDRIASITHYGFYVLVLLMVGTGFATAILARLNEIVFQGSGDLLPPTFAVYPSFVAHGYFATLLVGFIVVHVLATLYHHFVTKDGPFRRMWFGRRTTSTGDRSKCSA